MKKSFKVKGIKNLAKSEMELTRGASCTGVGDDIIIHCSSSFHDNTALDSVNKTVIIIIGDKFSVGAPAQMSANNIADAKMV